MSANFSWVVEEDVWAGRVQVVLIVADCVVLLVTLLLGSAANVFVVHAVRRHKSLQTANNALLVNLALVDLLRCVTDCPLLLLVVLRARGRADLGLALCSAQLACFSLSCGAQLLTVAGISLERHRAVARPFEGGGGGGERRKRVTAWIPFTWAAPALASGLCARYARDSPVYARCRGVRAQELHTYDSFGRYVLLPAWCACLAVIAVCYAHIFIVVRAHGRKIFDKGVFPPPGKKKGEKKDKEKGSKVDIVIAHEVSKTHLVPELNGAGKTVPEGAPGSTDSQTATTVSVTLVSELRENAPEPTEVERGEGPTVIEGASTAPGDAQSVSVRHQNAPEPEAQQSAHEDAPELLDVESDEASPAEAQNAHEDAPELLDVEGDEASPAEAQNAHEDTPELLDVEGDEASPGEAQNAHENAQQNTHENAHEDAHQDAQQKAHDSDTHQDAQENTAQNAQVSAPQDEEVVGAVCMMPSFANRDKGNKKKESKLAKRSGYIIFTFLIFWLPLMGTIVLNNFLDRKESPGWGTAAFAWGIFPSKLGLMTLVSALIYMYMENIGYRSRIGAPLGISTVEVVHELEVLAVCIACMTSLTNPIIYAAVNPQFRNEFYYLKNKCKALCAKP